MKENALWTRTFVLILLSNLFLFLALEMLLPTLPIFAADHGGTDTQIGLIIGLFTFSAIFLRLFVGVLSNHFGKKLLLIFGVAISLIGTGSYLAATTMTVMLSLRLLHGVGFGIATTLYGTVASDVIPAARRGEGLGLFGTGNALAISVGPFIGVWLMDEYGFPTMFVIGAIFLAVALLCTLFVKGESKEEREKAKKAARVLEQGPVWTRFVEPKVVIPSLIVVLTGFAYGGVIGFITLFGIEAGISNIGYYFLVVAISQFLIRLVSGRLFDTHGRMWVVLPSGILCIVGCVLLYYTHSMSTLLLAAVFYGAGLGALIPALQAWVIDMVEPHRRGVATATFYNGFDLGIGLGAIVMGMIATWTSYAMMFLISSLFYVVYLVIYFGYEARLKKKISVKGRISI